MTALRIALVAGEASGDILGSGLISELSKRFPNSTFEGIGGDLMIAAGLVSRAPMERLSVMGLVEVLSRLPELLSLRKSLVQHWLKNPPDVFIGIDAPDFTLELERRLKEAGITTVHYVSPSVWAWKAKRIYKIKEAVDLLLALFPFEAQHYEKTQQRISFVGHPLADTIANDPKIPIARDTFQLASTQRVIGVLPGSRSSEIRYLARPFLEAARLLWQHNNDLVFLLPAANDKRYEQLQRLIDESFSNLPVQLIMGRSREVMAASDVILIASGTATLEATLLKKPMVVGYKMAGLTYAIFSRMLKTPYVSLPNILAGEALVPEVLQKELTPERLCAEVEHWLDSSTDKHYVVERFSAIFEQLHKNADQQAADAIELLMKEKGILPHA
ncbi:lipid-A-disaccharide synthase [Neptunomonas phycophila]|uniref:lipid-A-disaccharide synthase n=1 Tax=Neptunomonas phycophila TaxID=1572645 RepID=UPI0015BD0479|nr:lipid-A-disaccharide synthase [Neptunomonas phycophila]QLE96644.1 lipid-A-disaccharide synthase [Neptunomonas phycophila]